MRIRKQIDYTNCEFLRIQKTIPICFTLKMIFFYARSLTNHYTELNKELMHVTPYTPGISRQNKVAFIILEKYLCLFFIVSKYFSGIWIDRIFQDIQICFLIRFRRAHKNTIFFREPLD